MGRTDEFNPALESVRGMAALSVAIVHSLMVFAAASPISSIGQAVRQVFDLLFYNLMPPVAAVIMFFVLSGYVLSLSLDRDGDIGRFIARRLFRILPAMWVAIIVTYVVVSALQPVEPYPGLTGWATSWYWPVKNLGDLFKNLVLQKTAVNGVTWTLAPEIVGSIALPFILLLHRRIGPAGRYAMLAVIFAAGLLTNRASIMMLYCFYLGALLPRDLASLITRRWQAWLAAVAGLGTMALLQNFNWSGYGPTARLVTALGAAVLVGALISPPRPWRFLSVAPLRFAGKVSYSFYLLHLPVLFVFLTLAARYPDWLPPVQSTNYVLMVLSVAATFAVAWLMYWRVEVPCMELGRRLTRKRVVQSAPAATSIGETAIVETAIAEPAVIETALAERA